MEGMDIEEINELSPGDRFWINATNFKHNLVVDEWVDGALEATEIEKTDVVGFDFKYNQKWRFVIDKSRGVILCYSYSPPQSEDEVGDDSRYDNETPNKTTEVFPRAFRKGSGP